jgi:hypothetical protein
MSDYELGKVRYWPTFSSTTKDIKVALDFIGSKDDGVLLRIFLSIENHPTNHVDCNNGKLKGVENKFSFFPSEQEVLTFPYFGFLTIKNEKFHSNNNKIDQITLLEIPF